MINVFLTSQNTQRLKKKIINMERLKIFNLFFHVSAYQKTITIFYMYKTNKL